MSDKYFGWDGHEAMWRDFADGYGSEQVCPEGMATDDEVLFASYEQECYEGSAVVIFRRDGKLYEVEASHCSCYGLEGQWHPGEVTPAALALRGEFSRPSGEGRPTFDALVALLNAAEKAVPQ